MDDVKLRAWWADRSGIGRCAGMLPAETLSVSGWARSVGGANPYLTLFSRAGIWRSIADEAVARRDILELPCARGCTYVVPAADFALALKVGQRHQEAGDIQTAKRHLGVTDAEIDDLGKRVVDLIDRDAMEPAALRAALGDAVRNLGAEGKKRGTTTTLPLALGRLQSQGEILRIPADGRIDRQRYAYTRWHDNPLRHRAWTEDEAAVALAERFFDWTGIGTVGQFQAFSGLGAKAAKEAVAAIDAQPLEPGSSLLARPADRALYDQFVPTATPDYVLLAGLDVLFNLRREVRPHLDPADIHQTMTSSRGITLLIGTEVELSNNVIVDRGRIVGLWEFEVASASLVWRTFVPESGALRDAVTRTETFIREQLGDCRSFSLDSPASRQATIDAIRAAAR